MVVNAEGAMRKSEKLILNLRAKMRLAQDVALEVLLTDIQAHTPTVDEEYDLLMSGGSGSGQVPRSGGSSNDSDGRHRLIKDESTYLANTVAADTDFKVSWNNGLGMIQIGNMELLLLNTTWAYQNFSKGHGEYARIEKGPYFNQYEYGSLGVEIVPVFPGRYPLQPDEYSPVMRVTKSVPPFRMFGSERLIPLFVQTMEMQLAQIGPGKLRG